MEDSLADRVMSLVRQYHAGSTNAAATAMKIPQQTLAQIVTGVVKNPRVNTLKRIADFYRVSVEWLLTGGGETPPYYGTGSELGWLDTLDRLGVSPRMFGVMAGVPLTAYSAVRVLICAIEERRGRPLTAAERGVAEHAAERAAHAGYEAWLVGFEPLLELFGPEEIREAIEGQLHHFALGYGDAALALLADAPVEIRQRLDTMIDRSREYENARDAQLRETYTNAIAKLGIDGADASFKKEIRAVQQREAETMWSLIQQSAGPAIARKKRSTSQKRGR